MRFARVCILLLLAIPCTVAVAAEVELINAQTPWRTHLVQGMNVLCENGALKIADGSRPSLFDPARFDPAKHRFSPMPPSEWRSPDFDDHHWARYHEEDLADYLGDYGIAVTGKTWPALICLRSSFGIADPAQATGLKATVTCLGGGIVYVNGREVGRGFMPAGAVEPLTPADDYPLDAYTTEDGRTALPTVAWGDKRETKAEEALLSRYAKRIRTFSVAIPPHVLVKGRNVIAVELHRSALAGPLDRGRGWSHVGFHQVRVTGSGGVIAYADADRATRVWTAQPEQQVADTLPEKSPARRSWFHALLWHRGMPVRGLRADNPFEPLRPVKMLVPRNGVASGQAVLFDPQGLRDVSASIGELKGPSGGVIPASAVQIRFAHQHAGVHYCDALMPAPPQAASTVPVWLIVQAKKDQTPGWYASTLHLKANGKEFDVPLRVLVSPVTLPEPKNLAASIGMMHSPDAVAAFYKVEPWSDRHFALMDKSLGLMGQMGNDVVHVPVIIGTFQPAVRDWLSGGKASERRMPMVHWVRSDSGLRPDFSLLERYLDSYTEHCAPPRAICLYIWDSSAAREVADAYEGRRIPSRASTPKNPLMVLVRDEKTGETSEMEAPNFDDDSAEAFWKPMLDGVRQVVLKRGWSERVIMVGQGGDLRPGQKTAERIRQWAPYARWNLLSHFSGDPGPMDGRMIATGGLEVGLKEWPWAIAGAAVPAARLEERLARPMDFLEIHTARWHHQEFSPPMLFRTLPLLSGGVSRLGIDFWTAGSGGPKNNSFFVHVNTLTVPGPEGAIPTVRFQLLREGVQDVEVRMAILRAYAVLPEEQRKPYRALLDELVMRVAYTSSFLSQHELSFDWPAYVARLHQAAAELAGQKFEASWNRPE